jgi:hypothetical protein
MLNPVFDRTLLIGIHGLGRSGKDTVADMIFENLSKNLFCVVKSALADLLKEQAADMLGRTDSEIDEILEEMHTDGLKEKYRTFMQGLGDARRAQCGDQYWVERVLQRLDTTACFLRSDKGEPGSIPLIAIVSDLRQPFEVVGLRNSGYKQVEILEVVNPKGPTLATTHISEQGIPKDMIDHTLGNDRRKGLDELRVLVDDFVDSVIMPKIKYA